MKKDTKKQQPEDDEDLLQDEFAREMYKEHILDHYKHPHNFGELNEPTMTHHEHNPLCGDDITIEIRVEDKKISDVAFHGHGCAISMASASLVTDKIKGMTLKEVKKLSKEDVLELLAIPISQVRLKCALLSLEVMQKAVNKEQTMKE